MKRNKHMEKSVSEKPGTRLTWAALTVAALSPLLLAAMVLIARNINPVDTQAWLEALIDMGYASAAAAFLGVGLSFNALSKSRSRKAWAALAVSVLMSAFWVFTVFDQSAMSLLLS